MPHILSLTVNGAALKQKKKQRESMYMKGNFGCPKFSYLTANKRHDLEAKSILKESYRERRQTTHSIRSSTADVY